MIIFSLLPKFWVKIWWQTAQNEHKPFLKGVLFSKHATKLYLLIFYLVYFHSVKIWGVFSFVHILLCFEIYLLSSKMCWREFLLFSHYCKVNNLWRYVFPNIWKNTCVTLLGNMVLGGGFWNKIIFIHGNVCANISFY